MTRKEYLRRWRADNRAHTNAVQREYAKRRYDALRVVIEEAKDAPCLDCGERYPFYVMHFDHVRGRKLFNVSERLGSRTLRQLKAEIKKCDVVCANCHAERTWQRSH